jgi:hypothetical protein
MQIRKKKMAELLKKLFKQTSLKILFGNFLLVNPIRVVKITETYGHLD